MKNVSDSFHRARRIRARDILELHGHFDAGGQPVMNGGARATRPGEHILSYLRNYRSLTTGYIEIHVGSKLFNWCLVAFQLSRNLLASHLNGAAR